MATIKRPAVPPTAPGADSVSADDALRALISAVHELARAESTEDLLRAVASAARRVTGAHGATIVIRDRDECVYVNEDAIEPLWRGMRFPITACVAGWTMLNRRPAVIDDIRADYRVPHVVYRPTFVSSLVAVPIGSADPVGAIEIHWARRHRATRQEVGLARALADSTAVALERVPSADEVGRAADIPETDPLTGLLHRRAWERAFADALRPAAAPLCVAFIELARADGGANGDPAGDGLLRRAAETWRAVLRDGDLLARFDGGAFGLLLPDCDENAGRRVVERLCLAAPDGSTASAGVASWDGDEVAESLLGRADCALHEAKAAGHTRVVVAG